MLIRFGVDDPDVAVVLTRILPAVSYIEKFAVGIVSDTVGTEFQLDLIQQAESVAAEYAEHPVITTGDEHLIERANIRDTLCFLKTGNSFQPFANAQIDHFQRAILEAGHEKPLSFDIDVHVVDAAINVWQGNRLNQPQGLFALRPQSQKC